MVMQELVRSWKKFGRPQSLVDQNTKNVMKEQKEDPVDEALGLFSRWLRQYPSLSVILMFIMSSTLLSHASLSASLTGPVILVEFIATFVPWMLVCSVAAFPILITFQLFPFKWDLIDADQRRHVELNLTKTNILLLLTFIVAPHVSLTSVIGFMATLVVFCFYYGVAFCWESIRLGVEILDDC